MENVSQFKQEMRALATQLSPNSIPSNTFSVSDYLKWLQIKKIEKLTEVIENIKFKNDK